MHRVELSGSLIVRIEIEAIQAAAVSGFRKQLVEETAVALASVEIEIGCKFLGVFVEDVHRTVQVCDEEPAAASGFVSQRIHSCQQHVGASFAVNKAGHGHPDVVFDLNGELSIRGRCNKSE